MILLCFVTFYSHLIGIKLNYFVSGIAFSRFPPVFALFFLYVRRLNRKRVQARDIPASCPPPFELRIHQSSARSQMILWWLYQVFGVFLFFFMFLFCIQMFPSVDRLTFSCWEKTMWLWRKELPDHMKTACTACSLALNNSTWREQNHENTKQTCFIFFIIHQACYWPCAHTSGYICKHNGVKAKSGQVESVKFNS